MSVRQSSADDSGVYTVIAPDGSSPGAAVDLAPLIRPLYRASVVALVGLLGAVVFVAVITLGPAVSEPASLWLAFALLSCIVLFTVGALAVVIPVLTTLVSARLHDSLILAVESRRRAQPRT